MTRHPETYGGAGEPVHGDVHEPTTLAEGLEGCHAAYYLRVVRCQRHASRRANHAFHTGLTLAWRLVLAQLVAGDVVATVVLVPVGRMRLRCV